MTLIIAASNNSSIVVGADSLGGRLDGDKQNTNAKKLYDVSDNCSIMVAGTHFSADRVDQFLLDFIDCVHERGLSSIDEVATALNQAAYRRIAGQIDPPGNLVFILAGFSGTTPKMFRLHSDSSFQKAQYNTAFVAAGKDEFAGAVCEELEVSRDMTVEQLKTAIEQVLDRTHSEFPNEVGGELKVKTLSA